MHDCEGSVSVNEPGLGKVAAGCCVPLGEKGLCCQVVTENGTDPKTRKQVGTLCILCRFMIFSKLLQWHSGD